MLDVCSFATATALCFLPELLSLEAFWQGEKFPPPRKSYCNRAYNAYV
jgi:hypothetical protein